jgi:uncharacterized membrane protein
MLRVAGVIMAILGIAVIAFATTMQEYSYRIQQGPEELGVASGQTPFQKLGVAVLGIAVIYIGYRVFRYIPPSEREREQVSELDLENEDSSDE